MKRVKLVYNPFSGDRSFKFSIDACVNVFQAYGYETHLFRTGDSLGLDIEQGYYDMIVVSGGDGTINFVLNHILNQGICSPLAIIPSGTANDFASYIGMPREPEKAAEAIVRGDTIKCDVGRVNGKYFINVCGAGLFTTISSKVDKTLKDNLGKLAYYLKGLEQLPNFIPMRVRIATPSQIIEDDIYFFVALNSSGAGGFEKLCVKASIVDGLFDFIAFRNMSLIDLALIFPKVMRGEYLNEPAVIHLQERWLKVECLSDDNDPLFYETDIDGEMGPNLPVEIENIQGAIDLIVPRDFEEGMKAESR